MPTLKIVNKQLRKYLDEKDTLVTKGRGVSGEIEVIEKDIEKIKDVQRKYTNDCNPKELIEEGDALKDKINKEIKKLEKIGDKVQKLKIDAIPQEFKDKYEALKKVKELKERERNKIALKVQKIKDRAIPIIQKEVKPHLGEFDDIETAVVKGEQIFVTTFNHLDEFKAKFKKPKQEAPVKA